MNQHTLSEELINRFPEHASQIYRLLLQNNDFREIAEDYDFCRNKLRRLISHPADNQPLILHYEKTMKELEEEMMGYLSR
jgi:hypothetical protein